MHQTEAIAQFLQRTSYADLSDRARERLKTHVLDSLGCALGALGHTPTLAVAKQVRELGAGENGACTLIGGGRAAPDRATLFNGALVRYVDYMDNYLAPKQTCHPCDTLAATLAAAEVNDLSGRDFMAALAAAYQVVCRMIDEVPVQEHGFDHTVQLAHGIAAGTCKALGMSAEQTANALALTGASVQGLVVTRADYLSQWKGLQSAHVANATVGAVFLARHGITGPLQVLEGKDGFPKAFGKPLQIDWSREDLERVTRASLKSYNAEVHTQPVIEAVLELGRRVSPPISEISRVEVEVFKQAYEITGSGEEAGDKYDVRTKEQADHSLPYLVAVALLDDEVTPRQFSSERIVRSDVQELLKRVRTLRDDQFTNRYPEETPVRVVIEMRDGTIHACERTDWAGFHKRPLSWDQVCSKFNGLAEPFTDGELRRSIAQAVADLEQIRARELTALLARAQKPD